MKKVLSRISLTGLLLFLISQAHAQTGCHAQYGFNQTANTLTLNFSDWHLADPLRFGGTGKAASVTGWALVGYAAVLYPLLGLWLGQPLAEQPMFGITPCPVTIFTFGVLLLAAPVSRRLLVVPVLWSLIGGSAAILLRVPQDWVLLLCSLTLVLLAPRRAPHPREAISG